jgi:hypothetical protein
MTGKSVSSTNALRTGHPHNGAELRVARKIPGPIEVELCVVFLSMNPGEWCVTRM